MCWGAQWNQRPRDLETGCHTRSLLQLHCWDDDVGKQCPIHLWGPPETCWQGLLDDQNWRQISENRNRLPDPWGRVYFGVCVQTALLAQMKKKPLIRIDLLGVKLIWFLCHIGTLHVDSHGPRQLNNVTYRKYISRRYAVILVLFKSHKLLIPCIRCQTH